LINRILTVGGLTLVSRVTGFVRDIVMAAVLGAGPVADAFLVAFRLPNHFRAIFAEGAFAAAFVPAYARRLQQDGPEEARRFADRPPQPKSDLFDFGKYRIPNSGKPEFGGEG